LIVVGVTDMEARIKDAMRRAEKVEGRPLKADQEALERDAAETAHG
jgi:hypothetical protein